MHYKAAVSLVSLALLTTTAQAEVFVAPFGGYSFGSTEFDIGDVNSQQTDKLKITESEHYGFMAGVTTKDPGNIYFLYSTQKTDLRSNAFSADVLTDLDVDYFHVGGSLFFPNGRVKPYVTVTAGVTHMRPSNDFSTETRFSMGFGGGVAYEITPQVALFADVRGYATFVNSNNSFFCGPNECVWNISADIMWQGQGNIGLEVKF
ncbi:outer membrane beta-barrel protein [Shewanella sp. UCD-KL21]|uniref:outer membrane beta-barrel protein n=1 Tax=Shewanella sp. UCD-KL21 TaxID=1917164 RepID=UPI0009705926|nr:outer membrane beta-barrel protein [Shewanella sp. UCD-KL21]